MPDLKHKYGYMDVPGVGIMATPPDLYSLGDTRIISFLDTCVCSESPDVAGRMHHHS
jgi:hypothetical protein